MPIAAVHVHFRGLRALISFEQTNPLRGVELVQGRGENAVSSRLLQLPVIDLKLHVEVIQRDIHVTKVRLLSVLFLLAVEVRLEHQLIPVRGERLPAAHRRADIEVRRLEILHANVRVLGDPLMAAANELQMVVGARDQLVLFQRVDGRCAFHALKTSVAVKSPDARANHSR